MIINSNITTLPSLNITKATDTTTLSRVEEAPEALNQASNDTLTIQERTRIQEEIDERLRRFTRADAVISTAYTEININDLESNDKYTYEDGTLTINSNGIYRITGSDNLNGNSIRISDGVEAYVMVGDINLSTSKGVSMYFADNSDVENVRLAPEFTMDSDMAKSAMRYVEFQILSRPENAIASQANVQPEAIYNLLGNGD